MATSEMTARGIMVFVAIMVPSAPKGHSAAMVSQPKPDRVPVLTPAIRPPAMTANTAAAMMVRRFLVFIGAPYASMGRTTMARSLDLMEPEDSDRHTAWQAPQPLQRSSIT